MATTKEYIQFVLEQLDGIDDVTCKKMFGEYGLYLNGKMFASVCDDMLFVKLTTAGRALVPDCPLAPPYPGAKDCLLIESVDDRDLLCALAETTCSELPMPKPRKKISK